MTSIAVHLEHAKIVKLTQEDKSTTEFGNILISQISKINVLLKNKKIKLENLQMVIVDEADFFFERPED